MIALAAIAALAIFLAVAPSSAQQPQPQPQPPAAAPAPEAAVPVTRETCTPQPECRLLSSKLLPGAPTTGMKAFGKTTTDNFEQKIFNDTSKSISRDSYRLPSPAK